MKRLVKKVAEHDADSRDFAIVCVGDKIYENVTHAMCLNDIYKDLGKKLYLNLQFRPQIEQFQIISDEEDTSVILAHRVELDHSIYYFYGYNNGQEMSEEEIKNKLGNLYDGYEIKNDLEHELTPKELSYYEDQDVINKMNKAIEEEEDGRTTATEDLVEIGFKKIGTGESTNYSCVVFDYGIGLYISRMPDYLQDFTEINGEDYLKSNFIEDFIDAVSKAKESAIAKTLISNGYNFDEDYSDDRMVFAKEVNGYTVAFDNENNQMNVNTEITDHGLVEYIQQAIGLENVEINDETLDIIEQIANSIDEEEFNISQLNV